MENANLKWKALNNKREPAEKDIETVRNEWVFQKIKSENLLAFFISLQKDWKAVELNLELLANAEWDYFLEK